MGLEHHCSEQLPHRSSPVWAWGETSEAGVLVKLAAVEAATSLTPAAPGKPDWQARDWHLTSASPASGKIQASGRDCRGRACDAEP